MDPVSSFWVLFMVSAAVFGGVGFLYARATRPTARAPSAPQGELARAQGELSVAQEVLATRDRELAQAKAAQADLEVRLARAEAEAQRAIASAAEQRALESARADAATTRLREIEASVAALNDELATARRTIEQLNVDKSKQDESVRRDLSAARRSADSERKSARELRERVESLSRDLEHRTKTEAALIAGFEARSARDGEVLADLKERLALLQKERDEERSAMTQRRDAPGAAWNIDVESALREHGHPTTGASGDELQGVVDRLARLDSVQSIAITDALGFVVAGSGEHVDALAAFGAFIAEAGAKAEALLPFRTACEVAVRDRSGSVLVTHALDTPDLSVVLLGSNGGVERRA